MYIGFLRSYKTSRETDFSMLLNILYTRAWVKASRDDPEHAGKSFVPLNYESGSD